MYISLYVDVNTFIGGRQPQNKLMRLRTFKKGTTHILGGGDKHQAAQNRRCAEQRRQRENKATTTTRHSSKENTNAPNSAHWHHMR